MNFRRHVTIFWQMVKHRPRITASVFVGLAVFYSGYFALVEEMAISDALLAGLGAVCLCVVLKAAFLTVFYRQFRTDPFDGSFLILAILTAIPLVLALAISMLLASHTFEGPPPDVAPFMLLGFGVAFSFWLGAAARISYWIGGGGLKRR
jgi:hypothetical protein